VQTEQLLKIVLNELEDRKGQQILNLDVREKTSFTDYMVIVTGTSDRHLQSLCDYVAEKVKENGAEVLGIEGGPGADWILLDLGDVIVHAMTAPARDHYQLEKLWAVNMPKDIVKQIGQ
jgi:ribosome-associated protein